jgi:hypothetical protein
VGWGDTWENDSSGHKKCAKKKNTYSQDGHRSSREHLAELIFCLKGCSDIYVMLVTRIREEASKREESSTWPLSSWCCCKKNLGHIKVENKKFISKAKQRKDRSSTQPKHGYSTSDNRCNMCFDIRGIYDEKVGGGWLKFTLGKVLLFVLTPGIISWFWCYSYQLGPKSSSLACTLNLSHCDIDVWASLWTKAGSCQMLPSGQVSILVISIFLRKHFFVPRGIIFPRGVIFSLGYVSFFTISLLSSQSTLITFRQVGKIRWRGLPYFPFYEMLQLVERVWCLKQRKQCQCAFSQAIY